MVDGAAARRLGGWLQTIAIGRKPAWTLVRICVLVGTVLVLFKFVFLLRKIESISMLPTFGEGSIRLINRLAYAHAGGPRRGDIVAIRTSGETVMYIKRVIGLPGETLAIRDNKVLIDGTPLDEPYVRLGRASEKRPWNLPPRKLEASHYFVMGDNRSMSQEQHEFGAIEGGRVVGKVIW